MQAREPLLGSAYGNRGYAKINLDHGHLTLGPVHLSQ